MGFHTHIRQNFSSQVLYSLTVLAFLPSLVAAGWGHLDFAFKMALLFGLIFSIEALFVLLKISSRYLGHSLLTGVYLSFFLPVSLPWVAFVLVPLISVGLFKWIFGVSGYWVNPALAGFLVAFVSWPDVYRDLFVARESSSLLSSYIASYPISDVDTAMTALINHSPLFEMLLINVPPSYFHLLTGQVLYNYISPLGVFLAIVLLWRRQVIKWSISISFFIVFFPLIYLLEGNLLWHDALFMGDSFFYFLSPITLLAIFFLAPENQTSPLNRIEMVLYGILCGLFSFLFLLLWTSPFSILLGVLAGQMICPLFGFYQIFYKMVRRNWERSTGSSSLNQDMQKESEE
jgi:electron transport complex protein RnfD